jgi:adenosine deaminase
VAEEVARLAVERIDRGVLGLDLAGSEAESPASPFLGVFNEARQAGLKITLHAGEWGGPENVREAIEKFDSQRIGHGVRIMEDPRLVEIARERSTTFEVCITSNYQSGVVPKLTAHPFAAMLDAGLNATLNTDDPSVSQIVLSHEYRTANEELGVRLKTLRDQTLAAAQASFLPDAERADLIAALSKKFEKVLPGL